MPLTATQVEALREGVASGQLSQEQMDAAITNRSTSAAERETRLAELEAAYSEREKAIRQARFVLEDAGVPEAEVDAMSESERLRFAAIAIEKSFEKDLSEDWATNAEAAHRPRPVDPFGSSIDRHGRQVAPESS